MNYCVKCGKELTKDEIGLHKRLINRGSKEFMCKECLAQYFRVSTKLLDERIQAYRSQGCTLFL